VVVKLIFGSELEPRNSGLISAVAAAAAVHSNLVRVYGIRLLPAGAVSATECRKLAVAAEAAGEATAEAMATAALRPGEGVLAVLMELCSMVGGGSATSCLGCHGLSPPGMSSPGAGRGHAASRNC
jgi:hypothetical protein